MRFFSHLPLLAALASTIAPIAAQPQKQLARSPRIQSANSVYLEDKTGVDAVGNKALAQLKKWGRFQIVQDRKQADLIFMLSADPYKGGHIITSGGQTGTVEKARPDCAFSEVGHYAPDSSHRFKKRSGVSLGTSGKSWAGLRTSKQKPRMLSALSAKMK